MMRVGQGNTSWSPKSVSWLDQLHYEESHQQQKGSLSFTCPLNLEPWVVLVLEG